MLLVSLTVHHVLRANQLSFATIHAPVHSSPKFILFAAAKGLEPTPAVGERRGEVGTGCQSVTGLTHKPEKKTHSHSRLRAF